MNHLTQAARKNCVRTFYRLSLTSEPAPPEAGRRGACYAYSSPTLTNYVAQSRLSRGSDSSAGTRYPRDVPRRFRTTSDTLRLSSISVRPHKELRRSSALAIVLPDSLDSPPVQDELKSFDQFCSPPHSSTSWDTPKTASIRNVHADPVSHHDPTSLGREKKKKIWINYDRTTACPMAQRSDVVDRIKKAFIIYPCGAGRIPDHTPHNRDLVFATVAGLEQYTQVDSRGAHGTGDRTRSLEAPPRHGPRQSQRLSGSSCRRAFDPIRA